MIFTHEGFQIFIPLQHSYCPSLSESNKLYSTRRDRRIVLCASLEKEERQCDFFRQLDEAHNNNKAFLHEKKAQMIDHIEFICEDELMRVIRSNLSEPKSALVTSDKELRYYWTFFEEEMSRNLSLKFYNNRDKYDDFVTIQHYYEATAMSRFHEFGMPRTMRALFSSGIYNFYQRWDPQEVTGRRRVDKDWHENPQELDGLSFNDSDLGMVFVLLGYLLGVSFCSFIAEITFRKCCAVFE